MLGRVSKHSLFTDYIDIDIDIYDTDVNIDIDINIYMIEVYRYRYMTRDIWSQVKHTSYRF